MKTVLSLIVVLGFACGCANFEGGASPENGIPYAQVFTWASLPSEFVAFVIYEHGVVERRSGKARTSRSSEVQLTPSDFADIRNQVGIVMDELRAVRRQNVTDGSNILIGLGPNYEQQVELRNYDPSRYDLPAYKALLARLNGYFAEAK